MTFLSRLYTLEATGDRLTLLRRRDGTPLYTVTYTMKPEGVQLLTAVPDLEAEAQRLILQWAFDHQKAARLILPNPLLTAPMRAEGLSAGASNTKSLSAETSNTEALGAEATHTEALSSMSSGVETSSAKILMAWTEQGARMEAAGLCVTAQDFAAANRALGCKGAAWLERAQTALHVACLALINDQNQVLLAQRPAGKSFAGLWEFPGGKIDPGESPELALCREAGEELGIGIWNSCLSPLTFVSHAYDEFHLTLLAYVCYRFDGQPEGREDQVLKWWTPKDINPDLMPPANVPLIHAIQDLLG